MPANDVQARLDSLIQQCIASEALGPGGVEHARALLESHLADLEHDLGPQGTASLLRSVVNDRSQLLGLMADALYQHGLSEEIAGSGLRDLAGKWRPTASPEQVTDRQVREAIVPWGQVQGDYDVVVVGSGAGGGVAAREFATAGWRVLMVERGRFPDRQTLSQRHTRSPRGASGLFTFGGPSAKDSEVRSVVGASGHQDVSANDHRWGNNAMTLGGGTRLYGAQGWRFTAEDFTMASTYGTPQGSALADWPITLADMAPYYDQVEAEFGLAGQPSLGAAGGRWLLPAFEGSRMGTMLQGAAKNLGWDTVPVPLLINSRPHASRPACIRCSQCVGFECPVNARAGTHNTVIPEAVATGNLTIVTGAQVTRIHTNPGGTRATGVELSAMADGAVSTRTVSCRAIALGAGAIESARLLLDSTSDAAPQGLGNNTDQVGRHLQGHLYGGASAMFADPVVDLVGPGPEVALTHRRHHNEGYVGGGILANEFVPTPANTVKYLLSSGFVDPQEKLASQPMESAMLRFSRVMGPVQEVTTSSSQVRLDRNRTDAHGRSIVELRGSLHAEDYRTQQLLAGTAAQWLDAAGAQRTVPMVSTPGTSGPSSGQHQAGTCRMGEDPGTSVTNPLGQVWTVPNVLVVDAATHVTNGGVNPVLTVLANSMRICREFLRDS